MNPPEDDAGLVSSLGTTWGLFRHYWVAIKLTLTILATVVLLVHTRPIRYMADVAAQQPPARHELREVRMQLVADAGAVIVVLVVNTVLAVYKPRGLTRFGRRKQREERGAA